MSRQLVLAALLVVVGAAPVSAQPWARKMFSVTDHDFGVVARGAKVEFAFPMKNLYKEDVHIAAVRTSCGCTEPIIEVDTLRSRETGAIIARFNTRSFLGHRSATITVVIDQPYHAEVQLNVRGYIRGDVVFEPGAINFGEVTQGQAAEKQVRVVYAGRSNWQITDVRSTNPNYEVELGDARRSTGRVEYLMKVRLLGSAEVDDLRDELTLVTDDTTNQTIPLAVEGRIVAPLAVNPAALFLGILEPGQSVTKKLLVRGTSPFRIVAVRCADERFQFSTSDKQQALHFVPVTFVADEQAGAISQDIEIETDMGEKLTAHCTVSATIKGTTNASQVAD